MKLKIFRYNLMVGLMAISIASCSSHEIISENPDIIITDQPQFITVSIQNADGPTRTEDNSSYNIAYEDGLDKENKVESLVLYFFNKDGEPINVIDGTRNYFTCTSEDLIEDKDNSETPNVEKLLSATIVLRNGNSSKDNLMNLYSVVAIINYDGVFSEPLANKSLSELKGIVGNYASKLINEVSMGGADDPVLLPVPIPYSDASAIPPLLMTSSSYLTDELNGSGANVKTPTVEVRNISSHVKNNEADANASPVKVYVERVVAKVRLTTKMQDPGIVTDAKFKGKNVTAFALKDKKGAPFTVTLNNGSFTKQIYVVFENWGLHGTAQKSRLLKKVGNWQLENWGNDGYGWNIKDYSRSFWALNPDTGVASTDLAHFRYSDTNGEIGSSFFYCLENAADNNSVGTKSLYNPDDEISNRTQVFVKAKLVTLDDNNNAEILDLAEWGGTKYSMAEVKNAMLGMVKDEIFIRKRVSSGVDGGEVFSYESLPEDLVKLVSGIESGFWGSDKETDKRYMSYISLIDQSQLDSLFDAGGKYAEYDKAFFKDKQGHKFVEDSLTEGSEQIPKAWLDWVNVNNLLLSVLGAKVWQDGKTYYYTDITHFGKKDDMGLYGVVRNHIYDIQIIQVNSLGTPVLNPSNGREEVIIPQHPSQDEFLMAAQVNILSWRIVNNQVSLDW